MNAQPTKFSQKELERVYEAMISMTNFQIDKVVTHFTYLAFDAPLLYRQLKRAAEKMKTENARHKVKAVLKKIA